MTRSEISVGTPKGPIYDPKKPKKRPSVCPMCPLAQDQINYTVDKSRAFCGIDTVNHLCNQIISRDELRSIDKVRKAIYSRYGTENQYKK